MITSPSPSRRDPLAAVALAAVTLLLAAACGAGDDGGSPPRASSRDATADSFPALPAAVLRDLEGDSVAVRAAVSGPAVVNFWATWCGPCRREMPELARLHRELGERGLQVVGIAVSSGSPEEIRDFAERHGVEYELLRASREWARRHFRVLGMPTTLIVDRDGRVRRRMVGPQTAERLREALAPLLPRREAGRRGA